MADYKKMYTRLFNRTTDAIELLQAAQAETEGMFIAQDDPEVVLLDKPDNGENDE